MFQPPEPPVEVIITHQWYAPFEPLFCRCVPLVFRDMFYRMLLDTLRDMVREGRSLPAVVDGAQFAKIVKELSPNLVSWFALQHEKDERKQQPSPTHELAPIPAFDQQKLWGEFMQEMLR